MKILYLEDYNLDLHHWVILGVSVAISGILSIYFLHDVELVTFLILFAVLLALASMIDWKHGKIPDLVNLMILAFGLLMVVRIASADWWHHLIGGIVGYASIRIIEIVYRKTKKQEGIGRGDAKMIGVTGIWVAWSGLPILLLIASLSGIVCVLISSIAQGKKLNQLFDQKFAFAPAIALGAWSTWFYLLSKQLL